MLWLSVIFKHVEKLRYLTSRQTGEIFPIPTNRICITQEFQVSKTFNRQ